MDRDATLERLRRLTVEQLFAFCKKHQLSCPRPEDALQSKRPFLERLCQLYFADGLPLHMLVEVDILVQQRKPRPWTSIQLLFPTGTPSTSTAAESSRVWVHPEGLCQRLQQELQSLLGLCAEEVQVHAQRLDGRLWFRVAVHDSLQDRPYDQSRSVASPVQTTFFLYQPQTTFMLVTEFKKKHLEEPLVGAMARTLGASKFHHIPLRGFNADSLLELLLNQQSQGAFRKYRTEAVDLSPLERDSLQRQLEASERKRKGRKRYLDEGGGGGGGASVVREDEEHLAKRHKAVVDELGEEHPCLEEILISYSGRFDAATLSTPTLVGQPLKLKFTLQGNSVLDGVQKLCASSAVRHPIPEVFLALPGCGASAVRLDAEGRVHPRAPSKKTHKKKKKKSVPRVGEEAV